MCHAGLFSSKLLVFMVARTFDANKFVCTGTLCNSHAIISYKPSLWNTISLARFFAPVRLCVKIPCDVRADFASRTTRLRRRDTRTQEHHGPRTKKRLDTYHSRHRPGHRFLLDPHLYHHQRHPLATPPRPGIPREAPEEPRPGPGTTTPATSSSSPRGAGGPGASTGRRTVGREHAAGSPPRCGRERDVDAGF